MHTIWLLTIFTSCVAYATPVAQNGRWQPEWESRNKDDKAAASSAPAPLSILPLPSSSTAHTTSTTSPTSVISASVLGNPSASPNPPPDAKLSADLLTAVSASSRMQILQWAVGNKTADFKFDLNPAANPGTPGVGGEVILANRVSFPALTGLGVAFAGLFFAPCGLNTPHIHPRATEVLTLVTPGSLSSGFVFENTFAMEVSETLLQFQGMAFPQGSIHWQLNNECTPQVAIAGFSDEDPGASSIAQNFFINLSDNVVLAALGYPAQITPDNFKTFEAIIPRSFSSGIKECYARCGIKQ